MPSATEAYQKNFSADDFKAGARVLTVKSATLEEMPADQKTGKIDSKIVLKFLEDRRGIVLNKTNNAAMISIAGDDYDRWVGAKIEAFFDPRAKSFGGKLGGLGIRPPVK